jgi:hypothetical protein
VLVIVTGLIDPSFRGCLRPCGNFHVSRILEMSNLCPFSKYGHNPFQHPQGVHSTFWVTSTFPEFRKRGTLQAWVCSNLHES